MGSTDGKFLGSDEGIRIILSSEEVLVTILENEDVTTRGVDVGREIGYLDGYFGGSNHSKIEGLSLGDSLGSTDGEVLGSDEGVKLGLSDGKFLGIILFDAVGITRGLDVGTDMVSLNESYDGYIDGNLLSLFL